MTEQQKRELFISEYKTRCGLWPATGDPVSSARWFAFIDPLSAEDFPDLFSQVVRNRGINRAKPLLDHFQTALAQIREDAPARPQVRCARCQGSGLISVPAAEVHEGKRIRMCFDETVAVLTNHAFPCALCPAGEAQLRGWPKGPRGETIDNDTIQQANAIWAESYRLSGAREDDERPVSLQEFLRRKRSGELSHLRSRTGFFQDLKIESLRRQEARERGDTTPEPFELPTAGESLRSLLKAKREIDWDSMADGIEIGRM